MKESYLTYLRMFTMGIHKVNKAVKVIGLMLILAFSAQFISAQTVINWTGLVSTDATNPDNWNPSLVPWNNKPVIDSAWKFTNLPILNVDTTRAIGQITTRANSVFTINVAKGYSVNNSGGSSEHLYPRGRWTKGGDGDLSVQRNIYVHEKVDSLFITGGMMESRSSWLMGNAATATVGGYVFISGTGRMHSRNFPSRFCYPDTTMSIIKITEDGKLTVSGNFTTIGDSLVKRTRQIRSSNDRDIVMDYNSSTNLTTFYSRSKMAFLAEPNAVQKLMVGETGTTIRMAQNDGLASKDSLTWKYATTPGGPYSAFSPLQTGDTLSPLFATSGTFYIVCEGMIGTTPEYSNEVIVIVSSNKISINPAGTQRLKLGQIPYPLTVTENETATSREWYYTYTPGANYVSFVPAQTGIEVSPVFDSATTYYVTCKSTISGNVETAKEVEIIYTAKDVVNDIFWNGPISSDAADIRNWTPHSYLIKNNIIVDTTKYGDYAPVYSLPGNDSMMKMGIYAGAEFTLSKPENDTLVTRGDNYIDGTVYVTSGVLKNDDSYFRLASNTGVLDVTGGKFISSRNYVLMGNATVATTGGHINVHGTGVVEVPGFDRFVAADTLKSVITIWDEGKVMIHNNSASYLATINGWMAKRQLTTLPGWEMVLNATYAEDTTYTITAFDPTAITITPKATQILAIGELSDTLFATNTSVYDTLVWQYSTSVGGELISFDPSKTDTIKAQVSFDAPGTYYVICYGENDTLQKKSNAVQILVPDVAVTPVTKQYMQLGGTGVQLTVAETPAANSRSWKNATVSGGPYSVPPVPITGTVYNTQFNDFGVHYVICESSFGDDNKKIISNEVEVEVVDVEIAPSANQNITENTDGTELTVTETGTASGREWKYSATSDGPYTSFSPAQTGTSYTPNFATAGTYYVVCESTFGDVSFTSNEVRINVSVSGVNDSYANRLNIYPNPSNGSFVISDETITSYRVEIFNAQGSLVLSKEFNNVDGPQEIILETKGLYIVNLIADNKVKTNRLIIE